MVQISTLIQENAEIIWFKNDRKIESSLHHHSNCIIVKILKINIEIVEFLS